MENVAAFTPRRVPPGDAGQQAQPYGPSSRRQRLGRAAIPTIGEEGEDCGLLWPPLQRKETRLPRRSAKPHLRCRLQRNNPEDRETRRRSPGRVRHLRRWQRSAASVRLSIGRPSSLLIDITNETSAQVLLRVGEHNGDGLSRVFEYVMRASHAIQNPTVLLKTAFDVAAVAQHRRLAGSLCTSLLIECRT